MDGVTWSVISVGLGWVTHWLGPLEFVASKLLHLLQLKWWDFFRISHVISIKRSQFIRMIRMIRIIEVIVNGEFKLKIEFLNSKI